MARPVNSLSDADTRLAELNTQILELEKERSALLRTELESAETRVNEIESFIGVYLASSPAGGAKAPARSAGKKKATGKRRGRPPGKKNATKTAKKPAGSRAPKKASKGAPKKKRTRGNVADRVEGVKAIVKQAGKDGVSALRVSKDSGFPYASILKILNDGANFKKVGEKRDRRYFLK